MSSDDQRFHAMDSLRGSMMLLGVLFHAALPYMVTPRGRFQDAEPQLAFDALVYFLHSFRMPLFFVAAGFFTALLCDRRGAVGMVRNRFYRVFIPLVVGWLVLAPLTRGAYTFAAEVASSGSIALGLEALTEKRWIRWDKPYHLWFLVVLLVFYPAALAVRQAARQLAPQLSARLLGWIGRLVSSDWRPLVLAFPISAGFIPAAFVVDYDERAVFLLPTLAIFFGLGWILYAYGDLGAQRKHAWSYVILAALILPVAAFTEHASLLASQNGERTLLPLVAGVSYCLMAALMIFGLLGVFVRHCDRSNARMRYLSDASYWIYLVHLPLVVAIGGILQSVPLPAAFRFVATIAVAAPILLLSYHWCVRFTAIGVLLNGRRFERRAAPATDSIRAASSAQAQTSAAAE